MKHFWKKTSHIAGTILVILAVFLALVLFGARLLGLRPFTVLSGSMGPEYPVGSLIYVRKAEPESIQAGDVITFVLNEELMAATHRVIAVDAENQCFYTKGDANEAADGAPVHFKNLIGRPIGRHTLSRLCREFYTETSGAVHLYCDNRIGGCPLFFPRRQCDQQ